MIRYTLMLAVAIVFVTFAIISSLAHVSYVVIRLLLVVVRDRYLGISEAWSQRSGGRAARAEHDENVTVLA